MRKVRIRIICGFCCANLRSELLRHLGSRTHTSDLRILLRKHRICGFCCANLGFAGNHLGSRNQISSIRGNKPTIDRARKLDQLRHPRQRGFIAADGRADLRARSIVASLPRWSNCFACAIDRGFVDAYAELLCVRDRSWVCCRRWPRFGCAILEDCVRI